VGVAGQDERELPCEVVHVLDGAREAEASGRRVAVRGVAGEEDPTGAEALGHDRVHRPPRYPVDPHRQIADAERGTDVGLDGRVGLRARIADRIVDVDDPLLGVPPPALRPHGHHDHADAALR
jgi:hypothetical protein